MPKFKLDKGNGKKLTDYLNPLVEAQQKRLNDAKAHENEKKKMIKGYEDDYVGYNKLKKVIYMILSLFMLLVVVDKCFFGGFYAGKSHVAAMIAVILPIVIVIAASVLCFFVDRTFYKVGAKAIFADLSISALFFCIMHIVSLGFNAYILVIVPIAIAVLIYVVVKNCYLGDLKLSLIVSIICILLSVTALVGLISFPSKKYCVENKLFDRSVRYDAVENSENELVFSFISQNVFDSMGLPVDKEYEVSDSYKTRTVVAIGENAFKNVRSVRAVRLPDSVTTVKAGAFLGSKVETVYFNGNMLCLEDGLAGSSVRQIVVASGTVITYGSGASLGEGIEIVYR